MWIENENPATRRMKDTETGDFVEFNDNSKAQVSKEVGKRFVDLYDTVHPSGEASSDASGDESENVDDTSDSDDTESTEE